MSKRPIITRVIKEMPTAMTMGREFADSVLYDGLVDSLTLAPADSIDLDDPDVLYVATDEPVMGQTVDDEGNSRPIQVAAHTELKAPHAKILKRHSFPNWPAIGKEPPA